MHSTCAIEVMDWQRSSTSAQDRIESRGIEICVVGSQRFITMKKSTPNTSHHYCYSNHYWPLSIGCVSIRLFDVLLLNWILAWHASVSVWTTLWIHCSLPSFPLSFTIPLLSLGHTPQGPWLVFVQWSTRHFWFFLTPTRKKMVRRTTTTSLVLVRRWSGSCVWARQGYPGISRMW